MMRTRGPGGSISIRMFSDLMVKYTFTVHLDHCIHHLSHEDLTSKQKETDEGCCKDNVAAVITRRFGADPSILLQFVQVLQITLVFGEHI